MQITGSVTKVERVTIDVSPSEMIKALKARFIHNCGMPPDAYINSEGFWETWEDTHGSGLYQKYREASKDELMVYDAFKLIEKADLKVHK